MDKDSKKESWLKVTVERYCRLSEDAVDFQHSLRFKILQHPSIRPA